MVAEGWRREGGGLCWAKGIVLNHDNWINLHVNSGLAQTKKWREHEEWKEKERKREEEWEIGRGGERKVEWLVNQGNYIKNYIEMISWESNRKAKASGEEASQSTHTHSRTHTHRQTYTFPHTRTHTHTSHSAQRICCGIVLRTCAKSWFQIAFAA